jgi:hypothetical protein
MQAVIAAVPNSRDNLAARAQIGPDKRFETG